MIRVDILKEVGGYDEAFSCQDGYDIWLKIAGMYPVKNINLPLFYYRQHEKSLSRGDEKLLDTRARIIAKHVGKKRLKPLSALAVIPVRGFKLDPRSFPLRMLGGKCLLDWTVDAALESDHVKDTLVSTPDDDVLEHIKKRYGSKVIVMKRDAGLARINMSIEGTITEAVDFYLENNKPVDIIMALYVEAPFRTSRYIDKSVHTMQIFDVDVVDGVRPDNSIFYVHDGGGLKQMREQNGLQLERENLYRREGGIHLVKWDFFKKNRKMLDGRIGHIVLDQKAGFMIRTQLDWEMACFMAGERKRDGLVEVS
jgi:CMP-N-acetylneuraminic acid synthetase